MFLIHI